MAEPQEVVHRWREAFNAHDEEGMRAVCADHIVLEAPGEVRLEGVDGVVGYAMSWLRAFPDAEMVLESEIVAGEWVVHRFVFEGTHGDTLAGPGGDIPATNRHLAGRGVEITRVEGGKIVEDHLYFDQVQVLTQLGLMGELAGRV